MTLVTATLNGPTAGDPTPARGYVRFVPTAGFLTPAGSVTLPLPKTVQIVDGQISVEITPTGPGWAWAVTYQILGLPHWTRYYAVPDVPTIALNDLTEVDIQTLNPISTPDPSWYAYVDSIVAGQVGVVHVVTGSEVRPSFGSVLWVGGTTQPTNMAENTDIWFKAAS